MTPHRTPWLVRTAVLGCVLAVASALAAEPVADVPATLLRGTFAVPLSLGDGPPLPCVFDTGMPAGVFLFDPATGDRLGLDYSMTAEVRGEGAGSRTGRIATGLRAVLGGVRFDDQRAIVLTERHALADAGVEAVIGETVLARFVVEIDPDAGRLRLHDPSAFEAPAGAHAVALTLTGGKPFVAAVVETADGAGVPVSLLLDTGAAGTLSLEPSERIPPPARAFETIVAEGIAGDVGGLRGRVAALRLGPFRLGDVIADFPHRSAEEPPGRDGVLGMGVLRRFRVFLDYPGRRVLLTPAAGLDAPFETDMAGLVLRPAPGHRLRVHGVAEDSPAAAAGLAPGDLIAAIDGAPVPTWEGVERGFRRDAATVRLTLERAGRRIDATLTLARRI